MTELKKDDESDTKADKPDKLKTLVQELVQKELQKTNQQLRSGAIMAGIGGGGNDATEFRMGGTMHGSLNVTTQYLSAGVPLEQIFGTGTGSLPDRLVASSSVLILNPDGSLTIPDNTIRTFDGIPISIESENISLSAFNKILLTPEEFYVYDNNDNSITFDSTDNNITLTTLGLNSWVFGNDGKLTGPNSLLDVTGDFNTNNKILSGGVDIAEIFGMKYIHRFDYVPNTSYSGKAVQGSDETDSVWTINRTIFTNVGQVSAINRAESVKWIDRYTATYN